MGIDTFEGRLIRLDSKCSIEGIACVGHTCARYHQRRGAGSSLCHSIRIHNTNLNPSLISGSQPFDIPRLDGADPIRLDRERHTLISQHPLRPDIVDSCLVYLRLVGPLQPRISTPRQLHIQRKPLAGRRQHRHCKDMQSRFLHFALGITAGAQGNIRQL